MAGATHAITAWIIGEEESISSNLIRLEDTVEEKSSPYFLPKTNGSVNERFTILKLDKGEGKGWINGILGTFRENLKWRLGMLLAVMWFANVTCK